VHLRLGPHIADTRRVSDDERLLGAVVGEELECGEGVALELREVWDGPDLGLVMVEDQRLNPHRRLVRALRQDVEEARHELDLHRGIELVEAVCHHRRNRFDFDGIVQVRGRPLLVKVLLDHIHMTVRLIFNQDASLPLAPSKHFLANSYQGLGTLPAVLIDLHHPERLSGTGSPCASPFLRASTALVC